MDMARRNSIRPAPNWPGTGMRVLEPRWGGSYEQMLAHANPICPPTWNAGLNWRSTSARPTPIAVTG